MGNKGKSVPGLFGTVHHYDEHGKKIGRSEPGLFGGYKQEYRAKGVSQQLLDKMYPVRVVEDSDVEG